MGVLGTAPVETFFAAWLGEAWLLGSAAAFGRAWTPPPLRGKTEPTAQAYPPTPRAGFRGRPVVRSPMSDNRYYVKLRLRCFPR